MDATQNATPPISCQTCGAQNPALARFCHTCRAPLHVQPFPPPLTPPTFRAGVSQIGVWPEAMIQADAQAAFNLALERLQTADVHVVSQVPRYSIRVAKSRRGCRYEGDLVFTENGRRHTSVRVAMKPTGGSIILMIVASVVGVTVLGALLAGVGWLISLGLSAYFFWRIIGPGPREAAALIMSSLTQETPAL